MKLTALARRRPPRTVGFDGHVFPRGSRWGCLWIASVARALGTAALLRRAPSGLAVRLFRLQARLAWRRKRNGTNCATLNRHRKKSAPPKPPRAMQSHPQNGRTSGPVPFMFTGDFSWPLGECKIVTPLKFWGFLLTVIHDEEATAIQNSSTL